MAGLMLLRHRFTAMACPCEIQLWCDDAISGQRACDAAQEEVLRIEAKYSRYRRDSVLSRINSAAGLEPTLIDAETAALLAFADAAWQQSAGLFDPTSGVLRRVWDFRAQRLPDPAEVIALLPRIGWPMVERSQNTIRLPKPGMELDFGGFGKEYAVDRAAGVLLDLQMTHALVNLGGDVRVTGPQADSRPWQVGIAHPRCGDAVIATVALTEGAVASSGDSERFIEVAGRRYSHVLDPRTGWPVDCAQLVSVQAPLCLVAGMAATSALLHGQHGNQMLVGRRFLWVDASGRCSGDLG